MDYAHKSPLSAWSHMAVRRRSDPVDLTLNSRLAAHALIDSFLAQQRMLFDQLHMRPATATVFLTIIQASSLCGQGADESSDASPSTERGAGAISRRSVAAMTGLPRETVRRIVVELIQEGLVVDVRQAGVKLSGGARLSRDVTDIVEKLAAEMSRLSDQFQGLGAAPAR